MTDPFLDRIQAESRLSDSLRGVLTEALHLQADSLTFTLGAGIVQLVWLKGGQEVKTGEMNASWFEPLQEWFESRQCPAFESVLAAADSERSARLNELAAATYLDKQAILFSVRKGARRTLRLSAFHRLSLKTALNCFSFSEPFNSDFEQVLQRQNGVILAAAPDQINLQQSVGGLLALGDFVYAGDLSAADLKEHLPGLSSDRVVIVSTVSDDAVSAYLRLRESGYSLSTLQVLAVVCQGFVRATCPSCARESIPDRAGIEVLPPVLRPPRELPYFVGRGCDSCGHSGYRGFTGISSTFIPDQALSARVMDQANHSQLVEMLYPLGTAALLEDGLKKLRKGSVTYEALFKFVRVAPLAYLKEAQRKEDQQAGTVEMVGEKRSSPGPVSAAKPLAGSTVFSKRPEESPFAKANQAVLLIVEDDPDQRSILEMVFKGANYEVRVASNGEQALTLLKREIPDLIISDLMMPVMDGREFVLHLKAETRYRDIPVLILTVVSDSDKEYALLDLGADDYCEKTIQRKVLLKRVDNLLKRSRR